MYNVVSRLLGRTHSVVGSPQNCLGQRVLDPRALVSILHAVSAPVLTSASIGDSVSVAGGLWDSVGKSGDSGLSCCSISSDELSMSLAMAGPEVHISIVLLPPPHGCRDRGKGVERLVAQAQEIASIQGSRLA